MPYLTKDLSVGSWCENWKDIYIYNVRKENRYTRLTSLTPGTSTVASVTPTEPRASQPFLSRPRDVTSSLTRPSRVTSVTRRPFLRLNWYNGSFLQSSNAWCSAIVTENSKYKKDLFQIQVPVKLEFLFFFLQRENAFHSRSRFFSLAF